MEKLSPFQIIALAVFGFLIVAGVGAFAAFGGFLGGSPSGPVLVWGTLDSEAITSALEELRTQDKIFENVTYVQKNHETYETDLLNALASGSGPDLIILPSENIQFFRDKVLAVAYGAVSQGAFASAFIEQAKMLLTPEGELGLPLVVDPLIMYWNTDLYSAAGIASPPRFWTELNDAAPKITALDSGKNVRKSAVAFGTWGNISHAKDLLSMLIMQAGDPIVAFSTQGAPQPVLGFTPASAAENPAASALRFFTQFANPSQSVYSWNRSLPKDVDSFAAGDLATYFGYASELSAIAARNPNLRFSVAMMPQIQASSVRLTGGNLLVLSIPRSARNPSGALSVAQKFTTASAAAVVARELGLAPARRDLLGDNPASASQTVINRSALIARSFLDPAPEKTDTIFKTMVESVTSGAREPAEAVNAAAKDFIALFPLTASQSPQGN